MTSFRRSSPPRNLTWVSYIAGRFFTIWATRDTHWSFSIWILCDVYVLLCPWSFSGKKTGEWAAISSVRGLPDPGIKLVLPASPALAGRFFTTVTPEKTYEFGGIQFSSQHQLILTFLECSTYSLFCSFHPLPPQISNTTQTTAI